MMSRFQHGLLVLLGLSLLMGCGGTGGRGLEIDPALGWVAGGEQEVQAYFRAIRAKRIQLSLGAAGDEADYEELITPNTSGEHLYLRITDSERLTEAADSLQEAWLDQLAVVIVDNLDNLDPSDSVLVFLLDKQEALILNRQQSVRQLQHQGPLLHSGWD